MEQVFERSGTSKTDFLVEFKPRDFFSSVVPPHAALLTSTARATVARGTTSM